MRAANEYYFEYFQCLRYDAALPYTVRNTRYRFAVSFAGQSER